MKDRQILFSVLLGIGAFILFSRKAEASVVEKISMPKPSIKIKGILKKTLPTTPADLSPRPVTLEKKDYVRGEIIVKLKLDSSLSKLVQSLKSTLPWINFKWDETYTHDIDSEKGVYSHIKKFSQTPKLYRILLPDNISVYSAVNIFQKDSNIEYAEPNYIYKIN